MILCNGRRLGRVSRLSTLCALGGFCALSFAIGCNRGSQPTPSTASPAANPSNSQNAPAPTAATSESASPQSVTQVAPPKPVEMAKKPFSEMTALEVALNPAAYGFKKNGSLIDGTMNGSDIYMGNQTMIMGVNQQWVKHDPDGKDMVLSVHLEKGKPVYARWGGF